MVSELMKTQTMYIEVNVLILVLVEDGLGVSNNMIILRQKEYVLILVLVEDGLGVGCIWDDQDTVLIVLILVLVEDGLGA